MSEEERRRWDARYRDGAHLGGGPSPVLTGLTAWLPLAGKALDVAGGAGRNAVWLAGRGLEVTVLDVSEQGLERCQERCDQAGMSISTLQADLDQDALPRGPWDLVLVHHFLQRDVYSHLPEVLAPGGVLVVIHPTTHNLERHPRPSARFLLQPGELDRLIQGLEVLHRQEDWNRADRHEAVLVGRRPVS